MRKALISIILCVAPVLSWGEEDPRAAHMYRLGDIAAWRGETLQARQWLRQAASLGHVRAMLDLGRMYESGRFGEVDYLEAARLYKRAMSFGNEQARRNFQRLEELDLLPKPAPKPVVVEPVVEEVQATELEAVATEKEAPPAAEPAISELPVREVQ